MSPPRGVSGGSSRPAWRYVLLALATLGGAAWLLLGSSPDDLKPPPPSPLTTVLPPVTPSVATAAASAASAARVAVPASAAIGRAAPPPAPEASDDLAAHVLPGQVPTMKEVIETLHQRGIRTGLGAFNPPGTRPPLIGLAVPEAFELPPGYLRHHQATDDGQRIEAILMFDPDHPPPVAAGRSLATPAERVVPAELAPPGLPIRLITLPSPADPGSPRR